VQQQQKNWGRSWCDWSSAGWTLRVAKVAKLLFERKVQTKPLLLM